ncbi:MAG TPA: hypothetical protein VEI04_14075 [Syntrophobacteria bacterium]|nr:hypothetical protein [Syntrophobacteria bacterium]
MKRNAYLSLVVALAAFFVATIPVAADQSWPISSPRGGGKITLVIRDTALRNFRIYDFSFADEGRSFSLTAEPARQSPSSHSLEIEFLNGDLLINKECVLVGSERTQTAVNCPERFDRIVIQ